MDSLGDGITSLMRAKNNNAACIVGNTSGSSSDDSTLSPQNDKIPITSSELSSAKHQKGSLINQAFDVENSSTHHCKDTDFESKSSIKHLADDSKAGDSSLSLGVGQLNKELPPSPPNSFYSATQYTEAKESFTITEASEGHSSIEKSRESGEVNQCYEYVESRKVSSAYRASTGSDVSDDSSSSSLTISAMYKPHKGNDVRWVAIRKVRSHYGVLQLNHFKLWKQLGCGDIGKVYLSELVGTRTYFAMKIMEKAKLESRKKLLRAQTEREILQSLDHPFLPTL